MPRQITYKVFFAGLLGLSLLLLLTIFLATAAYLSDLGGELILGFDPFSGVDRTGSISYLYGVLGVACVIFSVNVALGAVLIKRDRFLAALVAVGTLFVSFLIFLSFTVIISVNTS